MDNIVSISSEHIRNPDALWGWIKRESECDNIEHISVETTVGQMESTEGIYLFSYVKQRKVIITLGESFS